MEKLECPICVKKTAVARNLVCPYCAYSCCKQCYQTWLLSSDETIPRCMNVPRCQREFSSMFIFGELSQTFRKQYTKKLGRISLQVELQRLPLLQEYALQEIRHTQRRTWVTRVSNLIGQLQTVTRVLSAVNHVGPSAEPESSETSTTTRKCGLPECGGFLTSRWRCPVCETYTCNLCGVAKTGQTHDCDPGDVATMTLLRNDTKACPKCSVPIHKIDGCSQMFCVQCHTAFDWNTLRIERGRIHNPHYYEIQRQLANGREIPREVGDIPAGCADVEPIQARLEIVRNLTANLQRLLAQHIDGTPIQNFVTQFHNNFTSRISHLQNFEIQLQRQKLNEEQAMKRSLALAFLHKKYWSAVPDLLLDAAFFENCPPLYNYWNQPPFDKANSAILSSVMKCIGDIKAPKSGRSRRFHVAPIAVAETPRPPSLADTNNTPIGTTEEPLPAADTDSTTRWETELRLWETSKLKRIEFSDVLQTFTSGALDIAIESLVDWSGQDSIRTSGEFRVLVAAFEAKVDRLRVLCNEALARICLVFSCVQRHITKMASLNMLKAHYRHGLDFQTIAKPRPVATPEAGQPVV